MKAEERKELQTNSLARFIGRLKHNLKAGPSKRTTVIWGIVLLALAVFVGWRIASAVTAKRNSHRSLELLMAPSTDALDEFIDKNKGTVQAQIARLQVARQKLKEGLAGLYTRRADARDQLKEAAADFEALAKPFKATPVLVQECLLGAGKAYEGLGDFDKALDAYAQLEARFKEGPLVKEGAARAEHIKKNRDELVRLNKEIEKLPDPLASTKKD